MKTLHILLITLILMMSSCVKVELINLDKQPESKASEFVKSVNENSSTPIHVKIVNRTSFITLEIDSLYVLAKGELTNIKLPQTITITASDSVYLKTIAKEHNNHPLSTIPNNIFKDEDATAITICRMYGKYDTKNEYLLWDSCYKENLNYVYSQTKIYKIEEDYYVEVVLEEDPQWFYYTKKLFFENVLQKISFSATVEEFKKGGEYEIDLES